MDSALWTDKTSRRLMDSGSDLLLVQPAGPYNIPSAREREMEGGVTQTRHLHCHLKEQVSDE